MYTAWGYEVDELPPLCDVETYNTITGNSHAGDSRIESALAAASNAVRDVCGWHVAPSLECTATLTADGRLVKLPARFITAITSVQEDGNELQVGQWEASHTGLLRRCCFKNWSSSWDAVRVVYDAGFDIEAVPQLSDIVAKIVDAVLTVPQGVASETAGNVSITYNTTNYAIASATAYKMRWALEPYRVVTSRAL